ncbi:MAG: iron-sulfur cluster assembly scaffold protein [Acidobacteria bacterium]|nr:iron-sulfur cluster assembly scaffold protein [Acidobacteriota bacterium]
MYQGLLAEHIQNPRNVGSIDRPSGVGNVRNPICDDRMQLTLRIEGEKIIEARFKVYGCAPTIATGSVLTEMIAGRTIDEALQISRHQVSDALGGLPGARLHCAALAVEALDSAILDWRRRGCS